MSTSYCSIERRPASWLPQSHCGQNGASPPDVRVLEIAKTEGVTTVMATATEQELLARLEAMEKRVEASEAQLAMDLDNLWVILCAVLVFWMQAGFGMLEAGSVRAKNVSNILFKILFDGCMGSLAWYVVGYGLAFGVGDAGPHPFIGTGNFCLSQITNDNASEFVFFFFQLMFAAAAATIISGAVAERCNITAYFAYTVGITTFIYPIVVHWVWSAEGWLGIAARFPCGDDTCNGFIDFAGSGVVHLVGGTAALVAAKAVGPRHGRFTKDMNGNHVINPMPGHSTVLIALGTFILWMGWYGFNCGSTLMVSHGSSGIAGKIAVNTTLSAAMAAFVVCLLTKTSGHWDIPHTCNGALAGCVAVTAGCATVQPWGGICIGFIAGFIYVGGCWLMDNVLKIDDPVAAAPIHCFCGMWGCLAVGVFSSRKGIAFALGEAYDNDAFTSGLQFGTQLVGVLVIFSWSFITTALLFWVISLVIPLKATIERQQTGLDPSFHGDYAYPEGDQALENLTGATKRKASHSSASKPVDDEVHLPPEQNSHAAVNTCREPTDTAVVAAGTGSTDATREDFIAHINK
eukprot:g16444.t1